jgi:aspartate aminotransferase
MTIAVSQHAKRLRAEGRAIIDLGAGEPDFDTPEFVREAATRAIRSGGASRYTAVEGIAPLRSAIAERTSENARGHGITSGEVLVSGGSKQAIFNACFTLFGPGDEVLIPTPAWTSYYEIVELARARAVEVPGDRARGLTIDVDALTRAATPRTRGVILNSPCNPTGSVYDDAALDALLSLAEANEWWVIGDEIYKRLSYDAPAPGLLDVARSRERLVVIDGVAKSYAMPGWRIGWSVAPLALTKAMAALQSHVTFHPAAIAQHAAVAALTERDASDAAVSAMVASYRERRDAAHALLEDARVPHVRPQGAFYLFIDVSAAARGEADAGSAFAAAALEEEGVALVPGAAFRAPDWVRLSYAAPVADVLEGVRRVAALYRRRAG